MKLKFECMNTYGTLLILSDLDQAASWSMMVEQWQTAELVCYSSCTLTTTATGTRHRHQHLYHCLNVSVCVCHRHSIMSSSHVTLCHQMTLTSLTQTLDVLLSTDSVIVHVANSPCLGVPVRHLPVCQRSLNILTLATDRIILSAIDSHYTTLSLFLCISLCMCSTHNGE